MSDRIRQDTDDIRRAGDASNEKVPVAQEKKKTNEDYKTNFYATHGHAAHHFLAWVERDMEPGHKDGWHNVAEVHKGIHRQSHNAADNLDGVDLGGKEMIRRNTPDA